MNTVDMNLLEIIDPDLPAAENLVWTGTVDEYTEANKDWPMSEEELEHLVAHGFVVVGGGAAALFVVRYTTDEARIACQTFLDAHAQ